MKNVKKIAAILAATVMSLSSVLVVSADCKDSTFSNYKITGTSGYKNMKRLNDSRSKDDSSSVYFYVTYTSDKSAWMQVQACGVSGQNNENIKNCTLSSRGTPAKWATVSKGEQVEIYNSINESSLSVADLKVDHNKSGSKTFSFKWSPDTWGSFPIADTSSY